MSDKHFYLRPDLGCEALVNQWYAHPLLLAPATAAMTMATSHLSILKSYVRAPQMHAQALKNPAMRGGPFVNYQGERVEEISNLLDRTLNDHKPMLELAESIKALDQLLLSQAKGYSLEPLYSKVPELLRGYVELVYDRNNHPGFRFLEGLLYRSPYFDRSAQSLALFLQEQDRRPFIMATPRLSDEQHLHLRIPFDSEAIDHLFALRHTPQPLSHIRDLLDGTGVDGQIEAFLTEEPPPPPKPYEGDEVRVRFFGHACLLIQTKEVSILTDPLISPAPHDGPDRFTFADLPETIDYVLITHFHQDHVLLETLLPLRSRIRNLVVPKSGAGTLEDPSMKLALQHTGFSNVREVDELERIEVPGGAITPVPFFGEHGDLAIRTKSAYYVELLGRRLLCVADSSILEPKVYEHVRELVGSADALFLSMESVGAPVNWAYGAALTHPMDRKIAESRRTKASNYEQGIEMVEMFGCKHAYVYALGAEPWMFHVLAMDYSDDDEQIVLSNKLVEECRRRGLTAERLYCKKELCF